MLLEFDAPFSGALSLTLLLLNLFGSRKSRGYEFPVLFRNRFSDWIELRVCEKTGEVTFGRLEKCFNVKRWFERGWCFDPVENFLFQVMFEKCLQLNICCK